MSYCFKVSITLYDIITDIKQSDVEFTGEGNRASERLHILFISHSCHIPEPEVTFRSRITKASIISTLFLTSRGDDDKTEFYEKTDGNLGPLRVKYAQTESLCILRVSYGPLHIHAFNSYLLVAHHGPAAVPGIWNPPVNKLIKDPRPKLPSFTLIVYFPSLVVMEMPYERCDVQCTNLSQ